jgi:hypothetical protein
MLIAVCRPMSLGQRSVAEVILKLKWDCRVIGLGANLMARVVRRRKMRQLNA